MVGSANGQLTFKRSHRLARGKAFESLRTQRRGVAPAANSPSPGCEQGGGKSQWMKRAREGGGVEALKRRPAPGARPRLSEQQRMKLAELLHMGRLSDPSRRGAQDLSGGRGLQAA